jgi:LNS2 (Lipin/Ned1/Smp2)
MSSGFQVSTNQTIATANPRIKDEASDTLGVPAGMQANVYLADTAMPDSSPVDYHGAKARTTPTGGLFAKPLAGENVSLWNYDPTAADWQMLGRGQTGDDGYYDLPATGFVAPNGEPIYSMLEADGTCATHYDYLMPSGSKFVVVDIDGTLTANDNELIMQIADETHTPVMMTAANLMAQAWAAKGYPIVYLTARVHVLDAETRAWLDMLGFPKGAIITSNGTTTAADAYKTIWLQRMITDFGWAPVAAYGNATTDITAYANVSIPLDHTFIVGPEAGMGGTVAISNMDYTQHIATFINTQPDN